jgi:hypothetical protein
VLIGIHDADKTDFPNLALMKLSAAYKTKGNEVEFYREGVEYGKVVSSKVFTFTEEAKLPEGAILGGFSRGLTVLPEAVEHLCPDYSLYGTDYSMGFLTRGCPRKCSFCFVPEKEGEIRAHAPVEEFLRHKEVVLLDNNVLAHPHGIAQIERLAELRVKVDFNQGLDARLIDDAMARRLAKLKWRVPVRLACDSFAMQSDIQKAVTWLRWHNCTPTSYFVYVLVKEVEEATERIKFLKGLRLDPFAQPYIDKEGTPPSLEQRQLARWCNTRQAFKSMTFDEYKTFRAGRV